MDVYLATPSQIQALKDGRLIYSGSYAAGNQYIDTTNFPSGSYNVLIKVIGVSDNTREFTRFFVKYNAFPLANRPIYTLNMGHLEDKNQDVNTVPPEYSNTGLLQAGVAYRLSTNMALTDNLLTTEPLTLNELGVRYLVDEGELDISGIAATDNDTGLSMRALLRGENNSISAQATKLWGHRLNDDQNTFDPLTALSLQSSASYNQQLPYGSLSTSLNYNENNLGDTDHGYSLAYSFPWQLKPRLSLATSISYQRDNDDNIILFNFTLSYTHNNWRHSLRSGFTHYTQTPSDAEQRQDDYNLSVSQRSLKIFQRPC